MKAIYVATMIAVGLGVSGQVLADEALATKVKAGGKGVWGQIPMPPNNVTPEEAKKLVTWVLSQK